MQLIKDLFRTGRASPSSTRKGAKTESFSQYESRVPSHQNAVDLLPGWNCSFPPEYGVHAGSLGLFADERILWALEKFGSVEGKAVLEIGPLEGMHTLMINRQRPSKIDAVEANHLSYLRCLVADQIMDLDRAHFHLGDAVEWLRAPGDFYDLVVASGVLYHMANPTELLRTVSQRTDALFLWTHFYLESAMPEDDPRRIPFSGVQTETIVNGVTVRCYERSYKNTAHNRSFCGGMKDLHYWLHRDDIIAVLGVLGFDHIEIGGEDHAHPGGPCFSLIARRTAPPQQAEPAPAEFTAIDPASGEVADLAETPADPPPYVPAQQN